MAAAYDRHIAQIAREDARAWKAVIAIAAKNARMAWAVLARGEDFRMPA